MNMQMVRVVMKTVGVANGIVRMKSLSKLAHDFLHRDLQDPVRIDPDFDQFVVERLRHAEDEPMLDHWILRGCWEFVKVIEPRGGNPLFSLRIAELGWRGARAVLVAEDLMVKKTTRVNLT